MYAKQLRIRILQIISGCESSPLHQTLDPPSGQCDPKPAITGLALITITHDEMDIINLLGCLRVKLSFPFIHINRDMRTVHPPQEIPQVDTDDIIKPLQRVMTQKFQLLIQYGNTAAVHDDRLPQSTMTASNSDTRPRCARTSSGNFSSFTKSHPSFPHPTGSPCITSLIL